MSRSGCSMSSTVEPHGWISSTPACTSADQAVEIVDGDAASLAVVVDADDADALAGARARRASGRSSCSPTPSGQRSSASGRPTTCGAIQSPDLGVVVGQPLLGDAGVRPVDAVGMGEPDAGDASARAVSEAGLPTAVLARCACRIRGLGAWRLAHDLARRLVLAQALEGGVAQDAVAVQPRNSTSATSSRLDPAHAARASSRRQLVANGLSSMRRALEPRDTDRCDRWRVKPVPTRPA